MLKRMILVACVLSSPINAEAPINLRNAGAAICSDLEGAVRDNSTVEITAYMQWLAGFGTAVAASNSVVDVFPLDGAAEFLEVLVLICAEERYQHGRVYDATVEMMRRLKPLWPTAPETVELLDGEDRAIIYREAVRPLQERLRDVGAEVDVDGSYGRQTGDAISILHKALGVRESRIPSGASIYYLTK